MPEPELWGSTHGFHACGLVYPALPQKAEGVGGPRRTKTPMGWVLVTLILSIEIEVLSTSHLERSEFGRSFHTKSPKSVYRWPRPDKVVRQTSRPR